MEDKILEKYEKILADDGLITEAGLTKKHFNALAAMMKDSKTLDELKNQLVSWCAEMNPMFNAEKFKQAAGM